MSSGSIRIIQLPEKSSVNTDDYMAVDSSANGTKKVKFTDLLDILIQLQILFFLLKTLPNISPIGLGN